MEPQIWVVGAISGLAARLQKEDLTAVYVYCQAHCLNLCLQTVNKSIMPIKKALDLAMELGNFIELSPKRSHLFSTLQQQLSTNARSIKMLCPTRWTVQTGALEPIIENYKVLLEAMLDVQNSCKESCWILTVIRQVQYLLWAKTITSCIFSYIQNSFQPCFNQKA